MPTCRRRWRWIAHRGPSGAAPENTLAAVRLALAQKSDVVENDIQRTMDELVIMHDTTLRAPPMSRRSSPAAPLERP